MDQINGAVKAIPYLPHLIGSYFHTREFRPTAVAVTTCDKSGRMAVLLVRHRKGGAWMLPQGGIKLGETPASAALRELQEELKFPQGACLNTEGVCLGIFLNTLPPERIPAGYSKGKAFAFARVKTNTMSVRPRRDETIAEAHWFFGFDEVKAVMATDARSPQKVAVSLAAIKHYINW